MNIELQYFEDCRHWKVADGRLRPPAEALGIVIDYRLVSTPEEAEIARFRGSPTILIDGRDPLGSGDEPVGLSCRVYQTPDGPAVPRRSDNSPVRSVADRRLTIFAALADAACCVGTGTAPAS